MEGKPFTYDNARVFSTQQTAPDASQRFSPSDDTPEGDEDVDDKKYAE